MRKLFGILAVLVLGMTFQSCEKLDELTKFDIDYTSKVTIQSNTILNLPIDLFTPEVTTNSESTFESNNTAKDLVEEIALTESKLTITAPADQRFDFLNSIKIYINADGLGELLIASETDIPENVGAEIQMDVEENDLTEYIKKDGFSLRVETVTDKANSQDVDIDIYTKFRVNAKILGV